MKKMLFLGVLGVSLLAGGTSAGAAEPSSLPNTSFSTLKSIPEAVAKKRSAEWLQAIGKYDAAAFEVNWNRPELTLSQKVAAALALSDAELAALLNQAQDPTAKPAKEIPAFLKSSDEASRFARANFGLAYAKALSQKRVYEDVLAILRSVRPEDTVEPASYWFQRAVAEHALGLKTDATKSIEELLDNVADAPDRYKVLATLMFFDMRSWKKEERDLTNIARLMNNIERRLGHARGGPETQEIQKKVIFRLDELIKEMENQCKGGGGQCKSGNCPKGGEPKDGPGGQGATPMLDSKIATNGGKGEIDQKKVREYAQKWGTMTKQEREKAMNELVRDLPPRYREVIDSYFKALAERGNPSTR